jgi:hypothetical protein
MKFASQKAVINWFAERDFLLKFASKMVRVVFDGNLGDVKLIACQRLAKQKPDINNASELIPKQKRRVTIKLKSGPWGTPKKCRSRGGRQATGALAYAPLA